MSEKTRCPNCGAKESHEKCCNDTNLVYRCGTIGSGMPTKKCKARMWKRRAKAAEKEVERLREELLECRRDLFDEFPERDQGKEDEASFHAETERVIKGD